VVAGVIAWTLALVAIALILVAGVMLLSFLLGELEPLLSVLAR
jgi:hypothetical protein